MEGRWTIVNHHLALDVNGSIIHPSAKEVYSAFSGGKIQNTLCPNPKEEFPDFKFSKFGTELSIDLNNSDDGTICIDIYAAINIQSKMMINYRPMSFHYLLAD